jgi:hypothetical protein
MIQINPKSQRLILAIISTTVVLTGAYFAIQYGKGYRPSTQGITGTGLLAANSFPTAAEVYLDEKLLTASDDTINLPPGEYSVTIKKEGFIPWNKLLTIKEELVTQTNASLFRSVPSLTPVTFSGATNIIPSPDGQKIAFAVATASSELKNGIYILELSGNNLTSSKTPKQIANSSNGIDLTQANLLWSPDSSQLILHLEPDTGQISGNYLLPIDNNSNLQTLPDVTARLSIILAEWEEQIALEETRQYQLLPPEMQAIATQSATNFFLSPNQEKFMYTATASAIIPDNIIEKPLTTNTQPEQRNLETGNLYLYDLKEDKNYLIENNVLEEGRPRKDLLLLHSYQHNLDSAATSSAVPTSSIIKTYNNLFDPTSISQTIINFQSHYSPIFTQDFQWYPDSNHLIITLDGKIDIIEYDATNWITVYSGPFEQNFSFPWPDGSKLVILTNLNPTSSTPPNLYSIDIK